MHILFGCIRFSFCFEWFSLYFCVSVDHFGFVFSNLAFWGLVFFHCRAKSLAGKSVSEMTYFVSSGT